MGCNNCYIHIEGLHALDRGYSIESHGDIGGYFRSIMNADLPEYTGRFYHPSQHDNLTEVKYDKIIVNYDHGLKEFKDGIRGLPLEAYIPSPVIVPDGVGGKSSFSMVEIMPKKTIVDEILRAQAELLGRDTRLVFKQVEKEIMIREKITTLEITNKNPNE
jgi:hypothetical protein